MSHHKTLLVLTRNAVELVLKNTVTILLVDSDLLIYPLIVSGQIYASTIESAADFTVFLNASKEIAFFI